MFKPKKNKQINSGKILHVDFHLKGTTADPQHSILHNMEAIHIIVTMSVTSCNLDGTSPNPHSISF